MDYYELLKEAQSKLDVLLSQGEAVSPEAMKLEDELRERIDMLKEMIATSNSGLKTMEAIKRRMLEFIEYRIEKQQVGSSLVALNRRFQGPCKAIGQSPKDCLNYLIMDKKLVKRMRGDAAVLLPMSFVTRCETEMQIETSTYLMQYAIDNAI